MGSLCSCFENFSLELSKSENVFIQQEVKSNTNINDFHILKYIDSGAYGIVLLCVEKQTNELRAIKMIFKSKIKVLNIPEEEIINEKIILNQVDHPYIIKLYSSFHDKYFFYFSMEYIGNGTLKNLLRKRKKFDIETILFYSCQILEVLRYLHEDLKIIYRDLKLENILIDDFGNVKFCDFGLAKIGLHGNTFCGTPDYMAPEILESILIR